MEHGAEKIPGFEAISAFFSWIGCGAESVPRKNLELSNLRERVLQLNLGMFHLHMEID